MSSCRGFGRRRFEISKNCRKADFILTVQMELRSFVHIKVYIKIFAKSVKKPIETIKFVRIMAQHRTVVLATNV